jgi:hypothetical protein
MQMTTMEVMKIPLILQRDFDPIRLSVDNLIKVPLAILYVILLRTKKTCFLLCFSTHYIRSCELDT